jgi:hypothetical protein
MRMDGCMSGNWVQLLGFANLLYPCGVGDGMNGVDSETRVWQQDLVVDQKIGRIGESLMLGLAGEDIGFKVVFTGIISDPEVIVL